MKTLSFLLFTTLSLTATPENSLIPDTWFQEITATDGSTQQCIIFTTIAGVEYTFYHSNELEQWTEIGKTYGLGQQFSAAMRETAPAPPPQDPENPPPPGPVFLPASITIKPSSGTAGGTVVSWPSLDHGYAVQYLITGTMDTAWSGVPLFAENYGTHHFFISHTPGDTTPPETNPILDTEDAAMIADLEAAWPTFNTSVTTAQQTAINTPPPPPPAPDSKGFWRIKADWSLDSDYDGILDHAEFAFAAANPPGPNGLAGNAFNADSDGDGKPDGTQIDTDFDGTFESDDVAPNERGIAWLRLEEPRYAFFEIVESGSVPIGINNLGSVLFPGKVWKGGQEYPLGTGHTAYNINNYDRIIGTPDSGDTMGHVRWWSKPGASPAAVSVVVGGETTSAVLHYGSNELTGPGPALSDSGVFAAFGTGEGTSPESQALGAWGRWQLPDAPNGQAQRLGTDFVMRHFRDPGIKWGTLYDGGTPRVGIITPEGELPKPASMPLNVIPHYDKHGNLLSYIATYADAAQPAQVYHGGKWIGTETYANALDIADDGTAILKSVSGDRASLRLNRKTMELLRSAPEIPLGWAIDENTALLDVSPNGWILAKSTGLAAAMLPIRINGFEDTPDLFNNSTAGASGVDAFSVNADTRDPSARDKLWIMAPAGGGESSVAFFNAPLTNPDQGEGLPKVPGSAPVTLSSSVATFDGAASAVLDGPTRFFAVAANAPHATGLEFPLDISMGGNHSISKPVAVKVMKRRTVRVAVYKVAKITPGAADDHASVVPPEADIQQYLNAVLGKQLNINFQVALVTVPVRVEWDIFSYNPYTGNDEFNGSLDLGNDATLSPEQKLVIVQTDKVKPAIEPDIQIFLMGGPKPVGGNEDGYNNKGWAHQATNTAWITAENMSGINITSIFRTLAHEPGHLLVGKGHPDEKIEKGKAPLPGTDHTRRLMCSGPGSGAYPGVKLVKGEWDAAEIWLRDNVDEEVEE